MKKICTRKLIVYAISVFSYSNLVAQNIVITDTTKNFIVNSNSGLDSSFSVDGEIVGIDSGSLKIFLPEKELLASVPFKQGKFHFSGFTKSIELVTLLVNGDYYTNAFFIEPGQIKIKYIYQNKFVASGTKENDLNTYFADTINKKNTDRFWELSNKMDEVLKAENLELYMNLSDSFTIAEKDFFKTLNEAIVQKQYGFYLLAYVNYYYISYGYFPERMKFFNSLPDYIKNSAAGQSTLDFLNFTKEKNTSHSDEPAYKFILKTVHNNFVALKKFKGKIIVLDFWASWCLPCIKTLPLLKKIHSNAVSKNVVFISVSIDKKEMDWVEKEKKLYIPWLSLLGDQATIKHYDVTAVPIYIIIGRDGKIVGKSSSLGSLYSILKRVNK
jgi:thiol-disulfide isomerase/thioredoxin